MEDVLCSKWHWIFLLIPLTLSVTAACAVPWSARIVHTYIPLSPTITFLICRVPFTMECRPVGREPPSLAHDIFASTFLSGEHWNVADSFNVTVFTAGLTKISGVEIILPGSPLNSCRDVEVGSPGSPFWPFIPGGPISPWGPCGPVFPGGPWTQICPLLVQSFLVLVWTALLICFCISWAKELSASSVGVTARTIRLLWWADNCFEFTLKEWAFP